jgi:diguanylate cyclase (GGDEF)-like protein
MPPQAIRIVFVEDNPADAELELRELKRAGLRVEHRVVDTEPGFLGAIAGFGPDVILSDFSMPAFDGMAALALSRERCPDTPFIFVSGTIGEEYAIRALKNGASDYVLKNNLVRLPAAVERALQDTRAAHARKRAEAALARLSRMRDFASGINAALVRLRDRDALFAEICRIAVQAGSFLGAHIGRLDAGTKDVIMICGHGVQVRGEGGQIPLSARDDEAGSGIVGRALRTLEHAVWNDVGSTPGVRRREELLALGIRASAAFPLLVEDAPVGVLILHAAEPGTFDEDETRLLREVAANVSFALELMRKQERINHLAYYDALTGLPNHALFNDRLMNALETARSSSTMMALMLIDLDRFKAINDAMGRATGDRVLQAVAQRLQETVGDLHRVARLGSNTFTVMFPDIAVAQEAARRLEHDPAKFFGLPFEIDGRELRLAVKAGIAVYPADGADAEALFRNAEASLKRAKETGERCLFYSPQINAQVADQLELERRLRKAVEHGELFLHFQPKYELASRRIVGLEALMRWQSPDGAGLVSPAKFVPVLEQTGLILEAGRQAIATATSTYCAWQARGLNPPRIAVNVSALQLRRRSFVADVLAALGNAADGGGVDIEVTESLLMGEIEESIRKLRRLREAGLHIALDDFGTGYSSLAYLSKLPLDALKIDRSFVRGMTEKSEDTSIITSIISLAQTLRLKVVAEGVETQEQAQLLKLLRCDQAQGYLFSPPVPAERIEGLLKTL